MHRMVGARLLELGLEPKLSCGVIHWSCQEFGRRPLCCSRAMPGIRSRLSACGVNYVVSYVPVRPPVQSG